jgi:hypothetical protein
MEDLWKAAIGIAGLGAIASFVLWSLYRQWLKLPIWTKLDKRDQLIVILVFLGLTFSFAVIALGVYAYQQHDKLTQTKTALARVYEARKEQLELVFRDQARLLKDSPEYVQLTENSSKNALKLSRQRIEAIKEGDILAADQYSLQLREELASYDLLISGFVNDLPKSLTANNAQMPLAWLELENNRKRIRTIAHIDFAPAGSLPPI